ncbi:hypothetical protein COJ13_16205 [Bacillus cereus]|uniref:RelA/SpoT domain-containing protein n=1 Tax=Bacillus cereus TaxID=1396 RepID=UPI000BF2D56C|nr:RelA/SpoT domain-containing protein [Bacillus cereus]PFK70656.1 hypothetical protein COJ13_16205 [Bacillus cereus]
MDERLSTFIENSKEYLKTKEDELKIFQGQIISSLEKILKENSEIKNYMLNGRVKKPDSLKEKIIRKINFLEDSGGDEKVFIDELLDDIIGVRILCLLNEDEDKIYNILKDYFTEELTVAGKTHLVKSNSNPPTPYLAYLYEEQPVPQKNGKGIYKLKLRFIPEEGNFLNIELQIKSLTHMFWGELDHMLFYKNYKYVLDNDLYSKMMSSVNGMLESLDNQLKDLKSHMSKNDKIKETKNMLTKTLYNSIHDDIKEIHKVELDLREVYTLLSQLFFSGCDEYQDALKISQKMFLKLQQVKFSVSQFQLNTLPPVDDFASDLISFVEKEQAEQLAKLILKEEERKAKEKDEDEDEDEDEEIKILNYFDEQTLNILEGLVKNLESLSKGHDIFWCCLFAIHMQISENDIEDFTALDNYKLSLFKISFDFIDGYIRKYIESFRLDTEKDRNTIIFINNCILEGLLECFYNHQKMNFFLENSHQEKIIDIVSYFIELNEDSFPTICQITDSDQLSKIRRVINSILKVQIRYYLDNKLHIEHLKELKENINLLDRIDWNPGIDTDNLDDIINGKNSITSLEKLQDKIYFGQEEDEEC